MCSSTDGIFPCLIGNPSLKYTDCQRKHSKNDASNSEYHEMPFLGSCLNPLGDPTRRWFLELIIESK